jgi:Uma2 family endonuclease
MARAIENISQNGQPTIELLDLFPRQGRWTESDYFRLPETNRIIELSEGRLVITPPPTDQHQRIAYKLILLLGNYVLSNNLGEVRFSPTGVRLSKGIIREPDIVFMGNEHRDRITEIYWGVPDLAVEILSKSTAKDDREDKFHEYEKAGVLEYWIVDPFKKSIEVFILENEAYLLFGKWVSRETAKSKLLDGFEVSIDEVMA